MTDPPLIGAVLCGGRSSRFGEDKALVDAGGRPMGLIVATALRDLGADPVVAVGGTAGSRLGLPTVPDRRPDSGPLGGLASVLRWAKTGLVLVAPCDLPLLRAAHLEGLMDAAGPDRAAVAVVDGRPQPSLGCWPAAWAAGVQACLDRGENRWIDALSVGAWTGVPVPDSAMADADTPAELESLLQIDRAESPPQDGARS